MIATATHSAKLVPRPDREDPEDQLVTDIGSFATDPMGYVMYAFPWDSDHRIQLCKLVEPWASRYPNCEYGPDVWQCMYLDKLGEEIRKRGFNPLRPSAVDPVQMATASGHGIGKGGLTSMLSCFLLDTRPGAKGIVTANTSNQLRTKTFAEIVKWRRLSVTSHWWDLSSSDMYVRSKKHKPGTCNKAGECSCPENWRLDGITWRKEQSEAFAGLHAASSSPFYIFDEGSAVHDVIYEVSQGGMTDGEGFFFLFGNPTRNKGAFFDAFHKNKHRWLTQQIDSRDCALPNKRKIKEWLDDFGEDSDFFRVRARGVFPRSGVRQLIASDDVYFSMSRELPSVNNHVMVLGVDCAWSGSCESVIQPRMGDDARTFERRVFRGIDPTQLASEVAAYANELRARGVPPAMIFVDAGGLGGGTYSRLLELGYPVYPVYFGDRKSCDTKQFKQKDAEMWWRMGEWLKADGCLDKDETLSDQLTHREYSYTGAMQVVLQTKDSMEEESVGSPDRGDALACTFAEVLGFATHEEAAEQYETTDHERQLSAPEWDPYA